MVAKWQYAASSAPLKVGMRPTHDGTFAVGSFLFILGFSSFRLWSRAGTGAWKRPRAVNPSSKI